jgi:hypothetical protein
MNGHSKRVQSNCRLAPLFSGEMAREDGVTLDGIIANASRYGIWSGERDGMQKI